MRLICIGHKAPAFTPRLPYHFISPHKIDGQPSIVIPDDYLGEAFSGRVLSEYTQLMVLAQKIEQEGSTDPLYFFQYRKFLSLREPTQRSTTFVWAFAAKVEEANDLFPTQQEIDTLQDANLFGPAFDKIGMAEQYGFSHVPRDLICFTLALSLLDDFDRGRLDRFASCPVLFPAPALGVYHPEMFVRHMRILKRAWQSFYDNYYIPREAMQRRVGGFLLERLHSFLIYEEMTNPNRAKSLNGYQVIVSDRLDIGNTA